MAELVTDNLEVLRNNWEPYIREITRKDKPLRWMGYENAVEHAEELAVHVFGEKPEKLLKIQRPNEPDPVLKYRLEVYQPETATEFEKVENVIKRIFTPGNFAIHYKQRPAGIKKENDFRNVMAHRFGFSGSLMNFVSDVALHQMLGDPNTLQANWIQTDSEGIDHPHVALFESKQVLDFRPGKYAAVLSDEKSEVWVGNTREWVGNVVYIFTTMQIIKAWQTGDKEKNKYDVAILYQHNLGYLPCRFLGGNVVTKGEKFWYRSFVAGVVPHWNKAVMIQSDLDGYRTLHMYPKLVQIQVPCSTCRGTGRITLADGDTDTCMTCKGTKYLTGGNSPYASMTIDQDELKGGLGVGDVMAYIAPPGNVIEEARKEIRYHIERGYASVNMEIINQVGEVQSGVAKAIDRQDLVAYLSDIAKHIFDYVEWNFRVFADLLYSGLYSPDEIEEKILPSVQRPVRFDYVSADAIIEEAKLANEAQLPDSIRKEIQLRAADVLFGEGSHSARKIQAEIMLNPFPGKTADDILAMNAAGIVDPLEYFISANIGRLVQMAIEANEDFLNLKFKEQREILRKLAEIMNPELKKANEKGIDSTLLEAQARLKGTVGGVQGIIEINRAVSTGEMSEQSAENLLVQVYGFGVDVAKTLIEKGISSGDIEYDENGNPIA